jgi:uncharacterized protein involved in outer membrane biogenesis
LKAFLISLGVVLVTALTAALIGPVFIDWTSYRALVEARGERLIGRPVTIGGDLDLRILPRPVIRAKAVRVPGADAGAPIFSAEGIELHLNLGALVLGRVEVGELALVAPEIAVDPAITLLTALATGERPARAGTLSRIVVDDATLTFADPFASGRLTVSGVDLQLLAANLSGPFKVTGTYGARGEGVVRPDFAVSIGSVGAAGPIRLAGRIASGIGDLSFDGALSDPTGGARYKGRLRLERELEQVSDDTPATLTAEALAELAPGHADFADVRLTAAGGASTLTFTGSGRGWWDGPARFSADFSARQIDIDGALEGPEQHELAGEIGAIARSLARAVGDHQARGRVRLAIDGAIWRGELVRDISAAVQVGPGTIEITSLQASLPGETQLSVSGRIDVGAGAGFSGDLVAETMEAGRLARWAAPGSGAAVGDFLARSRGKFSLRGEVRLDEAALALESVDGIADGHPFSGSLHAGFGGERPEVRADVDFDLIDLDRYLSADAGPSDLLGGVAGWTGAAGPEVDLTVDARARRVIWLGREAEGVELAVIADEEGADIVGFNVARFAAATIAAEGHVGPSPGGTTGAVQLSLGAEDLAPLLDFLGVEVPTVLGAEPSLRGADLVVSIESEAGADGTLSTLSAVGELAGGTLRTTIASRTALAAFGAGALEISAEIEASDFARIIGPSGLVPLLQRNFPAGAGRLAITASGARADGFDVTMVGEGLGGVLEIGGTLAADGAGNGTLTFAVGALGEIAAALGLDVPSSARAGAAELEAGLSLADGEVDVEITRGLVAGATVSGTAKIGGGAPRRVRLALRASELALPWFARSAFGARVGGDDGAERPQAPEASWPTELVDVEVLRRIDLGATLSAARLVLGEGVSLSDAEADLTVADGVLRIGRLEGRLDGGTIAVSGSVRAGDLGLRVEGDLEARDVSLGRLVTDASGRRLIGGRLNFESGFRAEGRSPLSLTASLEGSGTFAVSDPELPRFDAGGLFEFAGLAGTGEAVAAVLNIGRLRETALDGLSGKFAAANGRLKFGPARIAGEGLSGTVTSFIDVPTRRIDQEVVLEAVSAPGIRVSVIHAGSFDDIGREVELTDVPEVGAVRWAEPMDAFAVPPRDPEPAPVPGRADDPGVVAGGGGAGTAEPRPADIPPVGLIDQEIMDLPILEETRPAPRDGVRSPG